MKKVTQEHLPKSPEERSKLISSLHDELNMVSNHEFDEQQQQQVKNQQEMIKLRIKLIGDCNELSVQRISHLEQIFKHYCTHIFKIGKHMTFERLQYEKVHLTMDRLCVFLKDFGLIVAQIDGQTKEVLEKNQIVKAFKRISSNCRDLSFEEFITCLEKLAPIYYDSKEHYNEKVKKQKENREKRIAKYKERMRKKKLKRINSEQKQIREEDGEDEENNEQQQQQKAEQQNNKLVEDMMKDSNLSNPNDEVDGSSVKSSGVKKKTEEKFHKKEYHLTLQEKIQFFYQMIGVDNVKDFRRKMGQLNLPIFKKEPKKAYSMKKPAQIHVVLEENEQEDKRRLILLRQKLNQKRQRDKNAHSPVMSKEEYEERKRKREEKHTDAAREMVKSRMSGKGTTAQVKPSDRKKVDLTEREMSLDMVNHVSFDELKYKFDPKKYIIPQQQDNIYLGEYGSFEQKQAKKKQKKHDITATTMEIRKRTSSNIVQDFKRRAQEIQKNQFNREAKLTKFMKKIKNNQKILAKF